MAWVDFYDIEAVKGNDLDPWSVVRTANLNSNLSRGLKVLEPGGPKMVKAALVGAGHSLQKFWPLLKNYPVIFSTSRAHDQLVEKGIIPTYHVDTDCGAHKPGLVTPQDKTTYLLSLRCHPSYFDHVNKVLAFDHLSYRDEELEHEEYVTFPLTCHGGHTMLLVAHFMGFRDFGLFGFDFSRDYDGNTTDMRYPIFKIQFDNQRFETDKNLLSGAIIMEEIMRTLPDCTYDVYSNGLFSAFLTEKQTREPNAPPRNKVEQPDGN